MISAICMLQTIQLLELYKRRESFSKSSRVHLKRILFLIKRENDFVKLRFGSDKGEKQRKYEEER